MTLTAAVFLTAHGLLVAQGQADSLVHHADILLYLQSPATNGSHITIRQSTAIKNLFNNYVARNHYKKIQGFRVRIFFDNSQNARQRAIETETNFRNQYPNMPTYYTYQNLYFKVAVGDFRTKSEAMRFLQTIAGHYPGAFIIKDFINYPAL
ncbi:MAG: SPOR domain-containing protein [Prevotellaceae bacterium]|nr:SPOR domain-containing protein [Prevotellaceae bacterium]